MPKGYPKIPRPPKPPKPPKAPRAPKAPKVQPAPIALAPPPDDGAIASRLMQANTAPTKAEPPGWTSDQVRQAAAPAQSSTVTPSPEQTPMDAEALKPEVLPPEPSGVADDGQLGIFNRAVKDEPPNQLDHGAPEPPPVEAGKPTADGGNMAGVQGPMTPAAPAGQAPLGATPGAVPGAAGAGAAGAVKPPPKKKKSEEEQEELQRSEARGWVKILFDMEREVRKGTFRRFMDPDELREFLKEHELDEDKINAIARPLAKIMQLNPELADPVNQLIAAVLMVMVPRFYDFYSEYREMSDAYDWETEQIAAGKMPPRQPRKRYGAAARAEKYEEEQRAPRPWTNPNVRR